MGEWIVFLTSGSGTNGKYKEWEWPLLCTIDPPPKKIEGMKYLNVKVRSIKLLEGNLGVNLNDLKLSNGLLDRTPKAKVTKDERSTRHQN